MAGPFPLENSFNNFERKQVDEFTITLPKSLARPPSHPLTRPGCAARPSSSYRKFDEQRRRPRRPPPAPF